VLALVIDQLPAWLMDERLTALPPQGFFARLAREGVYAEDVRFDHVNTETAPGHAALFTGAPAGLSGILANERPHPESRKKVSFLRDDGSQLLVHESYRASPSESVKPLPGSSLRPLRVPTVADLLRRKAPSARIFSLSLKDRGALFGGGAQPTATLWFDAGIDRFVTSSAVMRGAPAWAAPDPRAATRDWTWTPVASRPEGRWLSTEDDGAGEGDLAQLGTSFPHLVRNGSAFRATPFADEALLTLAARALAAPAVSSSGASSPTYLAVSLSTHDYVSHVFGPDSWEAWDQLTRLDAQLDGFVRAAERTFAEVRLVLSADHGGAPLPERAAARRVAERCGSRDRWERSCEAGTRVHAESVLHALEPEARRVVGEGDWILSVVDPYVWLTPAVDKLPRAKRRALLVALARAAVAQPGIELAFDVDEAGGPDCRSTIATRLVRRAGAAMPDAAQQGLLCDTVSFGAGPSLYLVPSRGSFFDAEYTLGKGTSHGTPNLYDRAVPMFVWSSAPGWKPSSHRVREPLSIRAYARTLATWLDIDPPDAAASGRDLTR
jgi:hypothetical protein